MSKIVLTGIKLKLEFSSINVLTGKLLSGCLLKKCSAVTETFEKYFIHLFFGTPCSPASVRLRLRIYVTRVGLLFQFFFKIQIFLIYEIFMRYLWDIYKIFMRYYEIFMKYLINIYEIFMRYIWYIYEIFMKYLINIYEIFMRYLCCG